MGKRTRQRPARACDNCGLLAPIQFRITTGQEWKTVCKTCQTSAKHHPKYAYGGTWKQDKRN